MTSSQQAAAKVQHDAARLVANPGVAASAADPGAKMAASMSIFLMVCPFVDRHSHMFAEEPGKVTNQAESSSGAPSSDGLRYR